MGNRASGAKRIPYSAIKGGKLKRWAHKGKGQVTLTTVPRHQVSKKIPEAGGELLRGRVEIILKLMRKETIKRPQAERDLIRANTIVFQVKKDSDLFELFTFSNKVRYRGQGQKEGKIFHYCLKTQWGGGGWSRLRKE